MSRWMCAFPGCERGVPTGHALNRTSPKGEDFEGMCWEHFEGEPEPIAQLIEEHNLNATDTRR